MHGSAGGAHSGLAWSCGDGKWTDPILSKPPPAPRSACSLAFPESENLEGRLQLVSTCTLLLPGLSVHLVHLLGTCRAPYMVELQVAAVDLSV